MRLKIVPLFTLVGLATMGLASLSYAGPITVPTGLTPGEQYRLVLITADAYTSTDYNIADYNSEVTAEVNGVASLAALDTTWAVIGSTPTVNAIDNVGQDPDIPIYNTDGLLVADDATTSSGGLFSGSIFTPIEYDENGLPTEVFTFTGTDADGLASFAPLGPGCCGVYGALLGRSQYDDSEWVQYTVGSSGCTDCTQSLYAVSGVLTYDQPATTPEPGTVSLVMLGGMFLVGKLRSRRAKAASGGCP